MKNILDSIIRLLQIIATSATVLEIIARVVRYLVTH